MAHRVICEECGEATDLPDDVNLRSAHCPHCTGGLTDPGPALDPALVREQRDLRTARTAVVIGALALLSAPLVLWSPLLSAAALFMAVMAGRNQPENDNTLVTPLAMTAGVLAVFALIFSLATLLL